MLAVTEVAFTVISALYVKYFGFFYFEYQNITSKTKFYKVLYIYSYILYIYMKYSAVFLGHIFVTCTYSL